MKGLAEPGSEQVGYVKASKPNYEVGASMALKLPFVKKAGSVFCVFVSVYQHTCTGKKVAPDYVFTSCVFSCY